MTENWTRPNGLEISRVRVPLGVIGMIYESRPNVTADAAGLALKSGNAVILRSGSESFLTSLVIANILTEALIEQGLPEAAIQIVPTVDRSAVGHMLAGLDGAIDVIVQVSRLTDGSRKIVSIYEVVGMEGDVITMQEIFTFERQGVAEDGRVLGRFKATGIRPRFTERLQAWGIELPAGLFTPLTAATPAETGRR